MESLLHITHTLRWYHECCIVFNMSNCVLNCAKIWKKKKEKKQQINKIVGKVYMCPSEFKHNFSNSSIQIK